MPGHSGDGAERRKIIALIFLISKLSYINYTNDLNCGRIQIEEVSDEMEDIMSSVKRVYVEKRPEFAVQAKELQHEAKVILAFRQLQESVC